jgi:hypothetical protein
MKMRHDHAGGKAMLHYNNRLPGYRDISLVLSYAPLGLVSATHTEITPDGVVIDTGCITLSSNSEVDIVLSIRDGEQHMKHRLRARVTGYDGTGFRLAFQDCDAQTLEALLPYITLH